MKYSAVPTLSGIFDSASCKLDGSNNYFRYNYSVYCRGYGSKRFPKHTWKNPQGSVIEIKDEFPC